MTPGPARTAAYKKQVTEMRDFYIKNANKNNKTHKNTKFKKACALVLAAAMVSMTAVTGSVSGVFAKDSDADALCGITAHTHGSECCETYRTLACSLEEGEIHTHSADCYETERTLICDEPESEGHKHTDDCYTVTEDLTCGEEESDEHTHDESCYTEHRELTCGQEESEGHTHTDACYEEYEKLVCGLEEGVPHEHTDACYEEDKELICDIQEHQHTDECYAETEKDWKKMASSLDFNGNWAHDLVMMAQSQLDYNASSVIYITDEDGNKKGYTRYGGWYSDLSGDDDIAYGPWNATFVSFCLNYAGVEGVPFGSDCSEWLIDIKQQDEETAENASENVEDTTAEDARLYYDAADYTPVAGDLVFFGADDTATHVGIITDIDGDTITTIEGGSGQVAYHEYTLNEDGTIDKSAILGYVKLPVNPDEDEWKIKNAEVYDNLVTITDPSGNVSAAGDLPEGVTVTAEPLSKSDLKKLDIDKKQVVFAYDITLWLDGEEYEPEKPVSVRIIPKEKPETDLIVTHITTDESGEVTEKTTIENTVDEEGNITFDASSFSIYIAQSTQEVELSLTDATIRQLIDADTALLKWKATKDTDSVSEAKVTINNIEYDISDTTYDSLYKQIYNAMLVKAGGTADNTDDTDAGTSEDEESDDIAVTADTETSGVTDATGEAKTISSDNIEAATISQDTIWNIPAGATVSMNENITVASGARLVILGGGTLRKTGDYSVISKGTLCMQGSVFLDGNKKSIALVQVQSGEGYLADDFRIGNNNGCGVNVGVSNGNNQNAVFYMSGGIVGTKDIKFDWYYENNNLIGEKSYDETLEYIKEKINGDEYDYIKSITSEDGNLCGVQTLSNSKFIMSGGAIVGNKTTNSGGGMKCNDNSTIKITNGIIFGNQSIADSSSNVGSGGGIQNTAKSFEMTGGMVIGNHSRGYAGGINSSGNLTLSADATVAYNSCDYNGGAILVAQKSVFTMMDNARVIHNRAIGYNGNSNSGKGGAFRVVGTLDIKGGSIAYNYANGQLDVVSYEQNLGGAISAQTDKLTEGTIREATINLNGGVIEKNKANGNGGAMCLEAAADAHKASFKLNGTKIKNNDSKNNGGAIYLIAKNGSLDADILSGSLEENTASGNGGGIYLDLTDKGTALNVNIGKENKNSPNVTGNKAGRSGGGLYVARNSNNGNLNINLYNGTLKNNSAANGGGIGVVKGSLNIEGGSFDSNSATNGGGAYVSDGKVRMFGGSFTGNTVTANGGGICVSSQNSAADVVIRSGELKNNKATENTSSDTSGSQAAGNGGAIAVISENRTSSTNDNVTIGLLETHSGLNTATHEFTAFTYTDPLDSETGTSAASDTDMTALQDADTDKGSDNTITGIASTENTRTHSSCPVISGNTATGNGGGIYMSSSAAALNIYCLNEDNNTAQVNSNGGSIMTNGGTVNIGDSNNNNSNARGNVTIGSSMLVSGGTVNISGNMDNPYFKGSILVNIKSGAGEFKDNRKSESQDETGGTGLKDYKINYFENFKLDGETEASGLYKALQYNAEDKITAEGALFKHDGYKIIGWSTNADTIKEENVTYKIGSEIANSNDHSAWNGLNDTKALTLYAVWKPIEYTVKFDINMPSGVTSYSGSMENQSFEYGKAAALTKNDYKITGYIFEGWNCAQDGKNEKTYMDKESVINLTINDQDTVTLYAQWKKCDIDSSETGGAITDDDPLSYTVSDDKKTITEKCACGGHEVSVTISASESYYYDGKTHEATLTYSPSDKKFKAGVSVKYYKKGTDSETYTELLNDAKPTYAGCYKATVIVTSKDAASYNITKTYEASVEYEIKSPSEGFNIDVKAAAGQNFGDFSGNNDVTISNDDMFTVQVTASAGTDTAVDMYTTAPILSFDKVLPDGTSVIMRDVGASADQNGYYYYNITSSDVSAASSNTEIVLTSFSKMGDSVKYDYSGLKSSQNDTYRFIVDFSNATSKNYLNDGTLNVGFTYKYNNASNDNVSGTSNDMSTASDTNDRSGSVNINLKTAYGFTVTNNNNKLTVTAPAASGNDRWSGKSLILAAAPADTVKLPSDATMTVVSGSGDSQKTQAYKADPSGKFVVSLSWAANQDIVLSLNSDTAASKGAQYTMAVSLGVGQSAATVSQPSPAAYEIGNVATMIHNISLTVPASTDPSLKIVGTQRLFSLNDIKDSTKNVSLDVSVGSQNIEDCKIDANIQKKELEGYKGNYLSAGVNSGSNKFTLAGINAGAGSYRLLITVSKNSQALMTVPYYFVVQ